MQAIFFPFFVGRRGGQQVLHLATVVGSHALEPADGHRLFVHAPPPAGRLARPVAGAAENAREHVRLPVEEVRVREPALRDHPDVFRHVGVRRARPLAVDDLVVVVGVFHLCTVHNAEL